MDEKKKINIVFIIQREKKLGYKDIDHYLPFLYFLSDCDKYNFCAKGFIFDSKSNFFKNIDPRLKKLSNLKNVELVFLYKENFFEKFIKFLKPDNKSMLSKLFNKVIKKILEVKKKSINWHKELGEDFIKSNFPLIFTLHINSRSFDIVSSIKKYNSKSKLIVLQHGTIICDNKMVLDSDLQKNELTMYNQIYDQIDFFLATSKLDLKMAEQRGLKKDKGIVIGSPRYCEDWLNIKSKLELDGKEVVINENNKIKILFLIPKKQINIFTEELIRTIDFLSSYQEFEIVLLNNNDHYPKFPQHILNRSNLSVFLLSKQYSTSKLIDWAEIVFHAGTGVIFESFVKKKITVLPRYLSCNTLISDKYDAGFNLKNRDELRTFCNSALNSIEDLKNTYRAKYLSSNEKFIDDFVYGNTESVPNNIIKSMFLISDNFDKS